MKRYLHIGTTDVDITFLKHTPRGHVTFREIIPIRIYEPMPDGYCNNRSTDILINAQFAPVCLKVPPNQWLPIIIQANLPPNGACVTIPQ